ncbi:ATP-binding protein [Nocardioides sp. BP30]|uniref:ATP-binding protein n=1 Tax=Nocardioides sp. BP30 TaxID=3036374 RepID=UPI002468B674|nr:ATP-binding protein [Nocardioides sp. BP30]WGL50590.1 ATP-binding protein [Nocardioides sp. BP30]
MSEATPDHFRLSVPARPQSLDLVHPAIEQLWSAHPEVGELERLRFETAVIEIFANVVEHAFRNDPEDPDGDGRRLDLVLAVTGAQVEATFTDNGQPAELDLSVVTLPDADSESGRGLAMAIAALDDLSYEHEGGRNRWRLLVRLAAA